MVVSNLRELLKSGISSEQLIQPTEIKDLDWRVLSKSITLLRTTTYKGKIYNVFFIHTPTIFKTRGRYVVIEKDDKEKLALMNEMKGFSFTNFRVDKSGKLSVLENMPHIQLDTMPDQFREIYGTDNSSKVEVKDLLDLLDFIALLDGRLHMNPLRGIDKLNKYQEEGSKFQLGNDITDYSRKVYDFVTSREKPTLSYGFLLLGTENVDGVMQERRKFFQYPLLTNNGKVSVKEIEFTIPWTESNEHHLSQYIGHLIQQGSMSFIKGRDIYFRVDTSKLEDIRTLHEIPISNSLIKNREQARVVIRSLREFKRTVKEMAKKVGVPIRSVDNLYIHEKLPIKDGEIDVTSKTIYTTEDTKAGDSKFKDFMSSTGMKSMKYVEDLINKYLEGTVDEDHINTHLANASKVFKNPIMNEALKALFIPISGNSSLNEMYNTANDLSLSVEFMSNSLKLRLHIFGDFESTEEMTDFFVRATSSVMQNIDNQTQGYVDMSYDVGGIKGNIEIKTEITV